MREPNLGLWTTWKKSFERVKPARQVLGHGRCVENVYPSGKLRLMATTSVPGLTLPFINFPCDMWWKLVVNRASVWNR